MQRELEFDSRKRWGRIWIHPVPTEISVVHRIGQRHERPFYKFVSRWCLVTDEHGRILGTAAAVINNLKYTFPVSMLPWELKHG